MEEQDRRDDLLASLESELGAWVSRLKPMINWFLSNPGLDGTEPSYQVLALLAQRGALRASDLALEMSIDRGETNRAVGALISGGYVVRIPDPEDGRASLLCQTPEGSRLMVDLARARLAASDLRFGDWSQEEMGDFVADLRRFNAALGGESS